MRLFNFIRKLRKKYFSWYYFGKTNVRVHGKIQVLRKDHVTIGDNCAINAGVILEAGNGLKIGNNVVISSNTMILASDLDRLNLTKHKRGTIVIEDDVWIGAGCIILKNTHIRQGSIVGAGSVVTKDVPSGVIAGGNPVRVIRKIANNS
jgi:acetyltransferase-like isoleucine patch superfamily enzyme